MAGIIEDTELLELLRTMVDCREEVRSFKVLNEEAPPSCHVCDAGELEVCASVCQFMFADQVVLQRAAVR